MSKYLDNAIKEMRDYSDMGLPDGETGGGMGSAGHNKIANAYKMLKKQQREDPEWLRNRQHQQRAEEEETEMGGGMRDEEMPDDEMGMGGEEDADMEMDMDNMDAMDNEQGLGMDGEVDTEEMKSFFQDNPAPSDEEVQQYADERGIDMEQMRQEVYALIQSLLGDSDPVGDGEEDDMGGEIEFSAPVGGDQIPDEEDLRPVRV